MRLEGRRMMRVRWACPNGCAGVIGPSRPRRDDCCRYCLACSAEKGRLVLRVAPALEAARTARVERAKARYAAMQARATAHAIEEITVAGVNLADELRKIWFSDAARDYRAKDAEWFRSLPTLRVRRCSAHPRSRLGWAKPWNKTICIFAYPGQTEADVRETLAHEVAHVLVDRTDRGRDKMKWHGTAWRTCFRLLVEGVYGVRPRLDVAYHGETSKKIDAAAAAVEGT
jgi:hypothetical protein